MSSWDFWVEEALSKLESLKLLRSLRPIITNQNHELQSNEESLQTFHNLNSWDRSSVEIQISEPTFQNWIQILPSSGDEIISIRDNGDSIIGGGGAQPQRLRKLVLFSGNDYLGLSSHPTVRKAAAEAVLKYGMGPRGSALICVYTSHHRLLESCLADLKKKEDCLLCPTGFAANMALMVALGSVGSLLPDGKKPLKNEKVVIFSDALNHASIIDDQVAHCRKKSLSAMGCSVWMEILHQLKSLRSFERNMAFCWSSMMLMEHLFVERMVGELQRSSTVKVMWIYA
ncbi:8-amino-7-oxononanoate synthase-like isoform X2 [Papaver somniferum]|uniref:8-amino-7-oxononanoate synthase-like isoform X2 n=1 Tax=Papaver somniferum TaxID=3469 RepID=UPI000E7024E8|nr:8-amino-7-oxononanoate synthase-like isoform X2 [Papaver somniferum]